MDIFDISYHWEGIESWPHKDYSYGWNSSYVTEMCLSDYKHYQHLKMIIICERIWYSVIPRKGSFIT